MCQLEICGLRANCLQTRQLKKNQHQRQHKPAARPSVGADRRQWPESEPLDDKCRIRLRHIHVMCRGILTAATILTTPFERPAVRLECCNIISKKNWLCFIYSYRKRKPKTAAKTYADLDSNADSDSDSEANRKREGKPVIVTVAVTHAKK